MYKPTLTQAIDEFILHCGARRLSDKTIYMYEYILNKLADHLPADPPLAAITVNDLESFLASQDQLSKKSLHHYHAAISSMYTWATTRRPPLVTEHLMRTIPAPQPEKRIIVPFTQDEIRRLLRFADTTRKYQRPGKRASTHTLPSGARNRAIILLLLDTGIRATELCCLTIADVDLKTQRITVMGKGSKERTVKFSPRTGEVLYRYLATRPNARANEALISTQRGAHFDANHLGQILRRLGKRAQVEKVHAHRFRHTFATEFLRNNGDPYTLQEILGHTSMEMVRKYIHIAQIDIDQQHRRASPVDNWHL